MVFIDFVDKLGNKTIASKVSIKLVEL